MLIAENRVFENFPAIVQNTQIISSQFEGAFSANEKSHQTVKYDLQAYVISRLHLDAGSFGTG